MQSRPTQLKNLPEQPNKLKIRDFIRLINSVSPKKARQKHEENNK